MDELLSRIECLENKIDKVLIELEKMNGSCNKMDNHISFVESIFNRIKNPLLFLPNLPNLSRLTN
jgi:hypothetical protein